MHKVWTGRKVTNGKEIFIETSDADWQHRLAMWKTLHYSDPLCPCPMPKGHVMFLNYGKSNYYKTVESELEK